MEKLTDPEILARLIYRAYIAPDPRAPLEDEALLPFAAALDLYARTWLAAGPKLESDRLPFLTTLGEAEPAFRDDPPDTHTHTHSRGK